MRSEVEPPRVSHSSSGRPTLERITPGEILSELPEITTQVRFWPKFLENHTAVNLQKISRGLVWGSNLYHRRLSIKSNQSLQTRFKYHNYNMDKKVSQATEPFDTIVSVSKVRYFCLKVSYRYRIGIEIPGSRKYQYSISIKIF